MDIQEEIKQIIATSVFLDESRKQKLLEILKIATPQEQEKLFAALKSEKEIIREILLRYIETKGEEAIENLDILLKTGKRQVATSVEKQEKKSEDVKAEALLDQLEQI